MDVRQLEAFLAVVDHGSFSAAARSLFTVQSNVSTHVARLEDEVGAPLIDRRTRQLTPAGRAVEARARAALHEIASITDEIASLQDRVIGDVQCGTTPSVGLWVLPETLAEATRNFPEVAVTIVEAQSDALIQQLLIGELDLAIATHIQTPDVHVDPLFDEDIVAVMDAEHRLATRDAVTLEQLAEETLLLPLPDNPLSGHIAQGFAAADVTWQAGLEVGSSALVSAMAAAGLGVALVPATVVPQLPELHGVRRPIADLAPREVALTTRAGLEPSAATTVIGEIVARTARAAARTMPGCRPRASGNR